VTLQVLGQVIDASLGLALRAIFTHRSRP
jgi:hypothetical protein